MFNLFKNQEITPDEARKITQKNKKGAVNRICRNINRKIKKQSKQGLIFTSINIRWLDRNITSEIKERYEKLGYDVTLYDNEFISFCWRI